MREADLEGADTDPTAKSIAADFFRKARHLTSTWQIDQRLGLNENNPMLAIYFLTLGLVRRNRAPHLAEAHVQGTINVYIIAYYQTPDERKKVRTLELAINDLMARATSENDQIKAGRLSMSPAQLDEWASRWRSELSTSA